MGKSFIISEKPSVAKDIVKALGGFDSKKEGGTEYWESPDYVVSSAFGHLVEIAVPEGEDTGTTLATLPTIPSAFTLAARKDEKGSDTASRARLMFLKRLLGRADVDTVINACDAGREGELIFRYIYSAIGGKKPMKRMWLQSMTADSIREGARTLRSGESMKDLYFAAQSRSEADWLIGVNPTRGLSYLYKSRTGEWDTQGAGRVQTPVLTMVVDRENKIRNFKPRNYWEIRATFGASKGDYVGTWIDSDFKGGGTDEDARESRLFDEARAREIANRCRDSVASNVWEESVPTSKAAPPLFDLTTLQREANKKFGLSASDTLKIAQALYETHKVLTYPRTDAKALPEDYVETAKATLGTFGGTPYEAVAKEAVAKGWVKPNKKIFDNSKITDHFAIVPTGVSASALSGMEQKIYDLVARRFIAVFYPPAEFLKTTRITTLEGEQFKSSGSVLTQAGWQAVYGRDASEDGDTTLAPVSPGELPPAKAVDVVALVTKAPDRYTDDTLLAAMEHAGRLVDDEEMREAMSEKGLGTPATRAAMIEKLLYKSKKQTPYLVREKKYLVPNSKAMDVIALLRQIGIKALTEPAMTGEWEFKLKQMERGAFPRGEFMAEIKAQTRAIIDAIRAHASTIAPRDIPTLAVPCPKCQGTVSAESRIFSCVCGFKIWREFCSRAISPAEAEQLMRGEETALLEGFVSSKKKKFSAVLKLNPDFGIALIFPDNGSSNGARENASGGAAEAVGVCPKCQSQLFERGGNYFCEKNTRESASCDFVLWGTVAGKPLGAKTMAKLLKGESSGEISGFKSSKGPGKLFSASLALDGNGKVQFTFTK